MCLDVFIGLLIVCMTKGCAGGSNRDVVCVIQLSLFIEKQFSDVYQYYNMAINSIL